jgi:hypothetical protein
MKFPRRRFLRLATGAAALPIITAALGAAVVTAIAAFVPDNVMERVPWRSLTWLVPLCAIIYVAYVLLPYATKS